MKSLNVNFYVDNRHEFLLLQLTAVLFLNNNCQLDLILSQTNTRLLAN